MLKLLFLSISLALGIDSTEPIESKYWLTSCSLSQCYLSFDYCFNCFGERGCKSCIKGVRTECSICADDIYNKNDLEIINGNQYFLCDNTDSYQVKACHLYCRGQFYKTGECVRVQNIPICQCLMEDQVQTTTSPKPIKNFNGILKLNISITNGYQRIYPLPNGDLVRGSSESTIQIWDIKNGKVKRNLTSAYFNPLIFGVLLNGDLVAGYQDNKTILVWDLKIQNEEPLKRIIKTNESFRCLTVLKDDDLAIGQNGPNFDIVIIDSQNGQVKNRLVGHTAWVYQIMILPNENLISCSYDKTVKLWNPLKKVPLKTITHPEKVYSICLLKNGNLLSGLSDGRIMIHNLETGDLIRVLTGHKSSICLTSCLHVLDNGNLLSGSWDFALRIWNQFDSSLVMISQFHKAPVEQVTFMSNGDLVTATSKEICIWK